MPSRGSGVGPTVDDIIYGIGILVGIGLTVIGLIQFAGGADEYPAIVLSLVGAALLLRVWYSRHT